MAERDLTALAALLHPFQEQQMAHIPTFPAEDAPGRRYLQHAHPEVVAVKELAEELLIDGSRPRFAAMKELERLSGVRVGPGEQDSFGWLTGCIHTSSGTIVYG